MPTAFTDYAKFDKLEDYEADSDEEEWRLTEAEKKAKREKKRDALIQHELDGYKAIDEKLKVAEKLPPRLAAAGERGSAASARARVRARDRDRAAEDESGGGRPRRYAPAEEATDWSEGRKHKVTKRRVSQQLTAGSDPEQTAALTAEWEARSALPPQVLKVLEALPDGTHPMTQLSAAVMALQPGSVFAKAYQDGIHKSKYWEPYYEDTMDLVAKLPQIAAMIYRRTYKAHLFIEPVPGLDWAANLSHMMGYDEEGALELMRLYMTIHTDHEGGNVSAHATHLIGSALSDPYLSYAAGMNGLAGPLHGLANQEVLNWLVAVQAEMGDDPTKEELTDFVWATLKSGKVVPGYGHAVLRQTDPRYTCQRGFALKHLPDDKMFKLVSLLYDVVPDVLTQTGKVKNPWPNVDAHSGVLLQYYGIKESNFYTVLFGVSRALGVLSQGVWSRALGLPIERPKSLTLDALEARFG